MRRTVLLFASMLLAVLLATSGIALSGIALAVTTSSERPYGQRFEPGWMEEPLVPQGGQLQALADHWDSVIVKGDQETLYYYNRRRRLYSKAVGHAARVWNALDKRFGGRGVRLIQVRSEDEATVRIDGIRDCRNTSWLGFAAPGQLGVNTCALNKAGWKVRKSVLAHEMGHHLGSGHQPPRFCGKSIMVATVACGGHQIVLTKPGPRDVEWYRDRWVR